MSRSRFPIVRFNAEHNRTAFNCASGPLNRYLRDQVSQDEHRKVAFCYVALTDSNRVAGYYTLSSASILLNDLPHNIGKKLPRYPTVPAVMMGRLGVDQAFEGQGLGSALLADALIRIADSGIASYALLVEAKDDTAAAFYIHHGFMAFPDKPLTLFLPMATIQSLL